MARVRVFKSYLKTPFLILLAIEVCVIFFAVYSAAYLRFINSPNQFFILVDDLWQLAAMLAITTPVAMLATGLYQGNIREGMSGILLRLWSRNYADSSVAIIFYYWNFTSYFSGTGRYRNIQKADTCLWSRTICINY